MIETTWLEAAAAFADADANISRAARALHLTQPAVHAHLKKLGEAAGAPLYRRAGRGVALTLEGREIVAFARDALRRQRELLSRVKGVRTNAPLVLAAGAGAFLYVLGEGVRAFRKVHPKVRLDLVTADADAAEDAVRAGAAEVGVAALREHALLDGLENRVVCEVGQAFVVRRDHKLAKRRSVRVRDLNHVTLVVPPANRPHRAMLEAAFFAANVTFDVGAVASGWALEIRFVELGAGATIVNACCAERRSLRAAGLVAIPIRDLPKIRYCAFTRKDATPEARALATALVANGNAWRSE